MWWGWHENLELTELLYRKWLLHLLLAIMCCFKVARILLIRQFTTKIKTLFDSLLLIILLTLFTSEKNNRNKWNFPLVFSNKAGEEAQIYLEHTSWWKKNLNINILFNIYINNIKNSFGTIEHFPWFGILKKYIWHEIAVDC